MIRMVIADDHALLRSGLARLLRFELDIVAGTSDLASTTQAVDGLRPDVLLIDPAMPGCAPDAALRQLRRDHLRIVVMTGTTDHASLYGLLAAGASAIVLKSSGVIRLREAIARVLEGRVFVDPDLQVAADPPPGAPGAPVPLTRRELEVMQLLAHGSSYRDIGARLRLGERTIETYRRRIADKLGVRSRAELIAYALRHGLVRPQADAAGSP